MSTAPKATSIGRKPKKVPLGSIRPWGRLLIGVVLGYIASVLATTAFTTFLPVSRAEKTVLSMLLVGLVFVALFIRVFSVPSWKHSLRDVGIVGGGGLLILLIMKGIFGL
ncbi:MAG: hypothetical protein AAF986_07460 [Pseudomonadota bacterium]